MRYLLLLIPIIFLFCSPNLPVGQLCNSDNDCKDGECVKGMCVGSCDKAGELCGGFALCSQITASRYYCLPHCSSDDDCEVGMCMYFYQSSNTPKQRRCVFHKDKENADMGCTCYPLGTNKPVECSSDVECGSGGLCLKGQVGSMDNPTSYRYCTKHCPPTCKYDADCWYCGAAEPKCVAGKCAK